MGSVAFHLGPIPETEREKKKADNHTKSEFVLPIGKISGALTPSSSSTKTNSEEISRCETGVRGLTGVKRRG